MAGVRATDGAPIDGLEHVHQSITKILQTRIGTRVIRRDFGSELPNLIDRPINEELKVDIYVATAEALAKWEPRLSLREVSLIAASPGKIEMRIVAVYLPDGKRVSLEGIIVR